MPSTPEETRQRFEDALAVLQQATYELTLFVTGASNLSARAIHNARQICDLHLEGRCQLVIIDVFDDPEAVTRSGVLAAPTLIRSRPLPVRRLVGDLSRIDRVLTALEIPQQSHLISRLNI